MVSSTIGYAVCDAPPPSTRVIIPSTSTEIIGPIEQSPVIPKESSSPSLSLLMATIPVPIDIINGTVIGPVVTPPESNANGRKSSGKKNEITKVAT